MSTFSGFDAPSGKPVPIPAAFFSELLPEMGDADELRLLLWAFQLLNLQEGDLRYLRSSDFLESKELTAGLGKNESEQAERLAKALEALERRNVLLSAQSGEEKLYFLNSPRGRAALEGLTRGAWQPENRSTKAYSAARPNVFSLYEQNIGPLTPMIAEELRDAEAQYPQDWIGDAIKIAVTKNARNWHYVEAILRSWKEKGRDERNQRSTEKNRKLDSEGQFGEFVRH